jgi:hypothetical protein
MYRFIQNHIRRRLYIKKFKVLLCFIVAFSIFSCDNIQKQIETKIENQINNQIQKLDTLVNDNIDTLFGNQIQKADTLISKHISKKIKSIDTLINKTKNK